MAALRGSLAIGGLIRQVSGAKPNEMGPRGVKHNFRNSKSSWVKGSKTAGFAPRHERRILGAPREGCVSASVRGRSPSHKGNQAAGSWRVGSAGAVPRD